MNAVAIKTPVPKCLERKRNRCGMGRSGKRRAMTGNEHAMVHQSLIDRSHHHTYLACSISG